MLTVAVPVAVFVLALFGLYSLLVRAADPFHLALLAGTAAVLVLAVVLASLGVSMPVCLVVLMLAPVVTVVGYETIGHRHLASVLERAVRPLSDQRFGAGDRPDPRGVPASQPA